MRHDYTVALAPHGSGDPDQTLYNVYGCGGDLNYNGYCNAEVDKLIDRQSAEADPEKRKTLVWQIEKILAEDGARPIIFFDRRATCWQPQVKGFTIMVNSILTGPAWRMSGSTGKRVANTPIWFPVSPPCYERPLGDGLGRSWLTGE